MEMDEPFYVRRKPDPIPFSKFLYNKEKGTVMGRTGGSWGKHKLCNYLFISKFALSQHLLSKQRIFNTTTVNTKNIGYMLNHNINTYRCGALFTSPHYQLRLLSQPCPLTSLFRLHTTEEFSHFWSESREQKYCVELLISEQEHKGGSLNCYRCTLTGHWSDIE